MSNLNFRPSSLYYLSSLLLISLGSIPKGYDEGGFSASISLPSFVHDYLLSPSLYPPNSPVLASRKANITSLGVLGAAIGALLSLAITDRLGRLRTWQISACVWMTGCVVQVLASGVFGLLLAARVWAGIGAGGLTVVAPLYLSEVARARSRGMVVSLYMVVLLGFLSAGFFINYGASKGLSEDSRLQYRLVIAVPLIPVGLALMASFLLSDTPRWLASENRIEEALAVLARLRGLDIDDERVTSEFAEIEEEVREKKQHLDGVSTWIIAKEVLFIPSVRERFLLGVTVQTIAQWSGGNGITYYIPSIFSSAGVSDSSSLITSGAYGIVKLVFTMVFTWGLVDVFGRRPSMLTGLALQLAAHVYLSAYFFLGPSAASNKSASDAAIASVFIYAVGWSIGLCNVQSLYGTETLPTRVRAVCYAVDMAVHWLFQFAVVRVTPSMFAGMGKGGAFAFWAGVCAVGLVLLGIWAPETKGVPMERMEELFGGRWWMGWRARVGEEEEEGSASRSDEEGTEDCSRKRADGEVVRVEG